MRKERWKLLLPNRKDYYHYVKDTGSNEMELYDLKSDPGEQRNVATQHTGIVSEMLKLIEAFQWPPGLPDTAIISQNRTDPVDTGNAAGVRGARSRASR